MKPSRIAGRAFHVGQRARCVLRRHDPCLPLAVIAEAAGFQDGGRADLRKGLVQSLGAVDGGEGRGGKADLGQKGPFQTAGPG